MPKFLLVLLKIARKSLVYGNVLNSSPRCLPNKTPLIRAQYQKASATASIASKIVVVASECLAIFNWIPVLPQPALQLMVSSIASLRKLRVPVTLLLKIHVVVPLLSRYSDG